MSPTTSITTSTTTSEELTTYARYCFAGYLQPNKRRGGFSNSYSATSDGWAARMALVKLKANATVQCYVNVKKALSREQRSLVCCCPSAICGAFCLWQVCGLFFKIQCSKTFTFSLSYRTRRKIETQKITDNSNIISRDILNTITCSGPDLLLITPLTISHNLKWQTKLTN